MPCLLEALTVVMTPRCRGLFLCVAIGLWAGLIIGYVTEYYTSNAYRQEILQFITC
jgi:Na+/H+-translocating membrane pyrophosphatase